MSTMNKSQQDLEQQLRENFHTNVQSNPYPGRALVLGLNDDGYPVIVYLITGRGKDSQNRILERKGDVISTKPFDDTDMERPDLLVYDAMCQKKGPVDPKCFLVSNGKQTTALAESLDYPQDFRHVLRDWNHEDDAPILTPRISGLISMRQRGTIEYALSIIKPEIFTDDARLSRHTFFEGQLIEPGVGFYISTYRANGNPPPHFNTEPVMVPLQGSVDAIARSYWGALGSGISGPENDFRVAIAVQVINSNTYESDYHIINRHSV